MPANIELFMNDNLVKQTTLNFAATHRGF